MAAIINVMKISARRRQKNGEEQYLMTHAAKAKAKNDGNMKA